MTRFTTIIPPSKSPLDDVNQPPLFINHSDSEEAGSQSPNLFSQQFSLKPLHLQFKNVEGEQVVVFETEKRKNLSLHDKITDTIYVSKFEGLSLTEYINVCCFVCNARHKQPCKDCQLKVEVARYILLSMASYDQASHLRW